MTATQSPVQRMPFKRRLMCAAVVSALSAQASANPTGGQVVSGQAGFSTQGSVLTVTNSPNAIINWQSFSIGANETTRFVQQSAASAVLNRVVGVDPSVILGTLQSNGKVFLINPSGILFGQGARIDVAGLVASTLSLTNEDFLAGRLNFDASPLSGSVVNRGSIATPEGGSVFLVGASVENGGIIHAPGGEVILAAGQSVRLGSTGAPNVLVEVEAPENRAINLGEIAVGAGNAGIYGGFVDQSGIVSADAATVNAAGKIVFKATRDVTLAAGSSTTANGPQGGVVRIEAGGTSLVEGLVSATGGSRKGGGIDLLGAQVGVIGNARVDASGAAGGGTIRVGGDYKGSTPDVRNARATFLGADAWLLADAKGAGDGGRIIVWSDEATRAYGAISARGGASGGNGGFVETSSRGFLDVPVAPDLRAPAGAGGTWLLDPLNLLVVPGSGLQQNTGSPDFTPTASDSEIGAELIANQLRDGVDVLLATGAGGSDDGNITLDAAISVTGGTGSPRLTLQAHNDVSLTGNAQISSDRPLHLWLIGDFDESGSGGVRLEPGASLALSGGDLIIGGGSNPLVTPANPSGGQSEGVRIASASISGAGNVSILGAGPATGVAVLGTTIAAAGDIRLKSAPGSALDINTVDATAGGNIEVITDNFLDVGNQYTTGTAADNYFRYTPSTPGTVLDLSVLDPRNTSAPRLQLGTPSSPDTWGTVFIRDDLTDGEFEAVTRSLEIYANRVDVNGELGPFGTPLTRAIIIEALSDLNVGNEVRAAGIRVRDAHVRLLADTDGNGTGNLTITGGNGPGDFVQVYVEQVSAAGPLNMDLSGANIRFEGAQSVYVLGSGTQTIDALGNVVLSNSGTDFLMVGSETLTALTAGGNLIIESLGNGAAVLSGLNTNSGGKNISVSGDLILRNSPASASQVSIYSATGDQNVRARSLRILGATGGFQAGIQSDTGAQTIETSGSGPNGWGIELVNNGSLSTFDSGVYLSAFGGDQQITARNAGGMLLNGVAGPIDINAAGSQTITLDGLGANRLEMRGAPGEVLITGASQAITAGAGPNQGSIRIIGGSTLNASASIFNNAGTQTVSTTGELHLTAGSGPAGSAQNFFCDVHACANIGQVHVGSLQTIVAGSIVVEGGTGGAYNEANIFSFGPQNVTARAGITITGGAGTGPGNWADIAVAGGNPFAQTVNFGTALTINVSATGGEGSNSNLYSEGTQSVTGTGDIVIAGGGAAARLPAEIRSVGNQTVSARSISIRAEAGPSSSGIVSDGAQEITTTGGVGGLAGNYGLSIRNLGSSGLDQNNLSASAYVKANGDQILDVTGSRGILVESSGGPAVINGNGPTQSITSSGALDVIANAGIAIVVFSSGTGQSIDAASISMAGGSVDGASAVISADSGTQAIIAGSIVMTGGSAPGPDIPDLANPPADCVPVSGCAVIFAGIGLQSITADSISMTGGTAGNENLVTIRGNVGQDISIGASGVTMQGGTGDVGSLRNFAYIESYAGDQILRFAAGAPLTLTGGTVGTKHFAAIEAAAATVTQQILGDPVITMTGGASGGGDGGGFFETFKGNNAAIDTWPGTITTQTIVAQSIDMQGGGGADNNAFIGAFGAGAAQSITISGNLRLRGGSAPNTLAEIYALGDQTIRAGSIALEAGGAGGPNNQASIMLEAAGFVQSIDFGTGLTLKATTAGANGTFARIESFGTQTFTGAGDIVLEGGVAGAQAWADLVGMEGQDITARSLSVTALSGNASVFLYNDSGTQRIQTTGEAGGVAGAFGITVRNAGATGTDQNGFPSGAAITSNGEQIIDVVNSGGLRVLGDGGLAIINSGQVVPSISVDRLGTSQTITVHGTGDNRIELTAGTSSAELYSYAAGAQTITAGLPGESGSITVTGGTQTGAIAAITADEGLRTITVPIPQTIRSAGALVLTGGTAPTIAPLNFDQLDCLPACASVYAGTGLQTIDAGTITVQGGASGSENIASIHGMFGQAITVRDATGLTLRGGGAGGLENDHSNFALIENYGGTQVITFLAGGAPFTIEAGDFGQRHFAGVYNGGLTTSGQQILGNPAIEIRAGTGGSGAGSANRFELSSNFAFLASESGAQRISASSISLRGGGSEANEASIANWGGKEAGSLSGSQTIEVSGDLVLQAGAGTDAFARVHSHSGFQEISVGGTLQMSQSGDGRAFLGNVFDPAIANLGNASVQVTTAVLDLQGGTLWGDEAVELTVNTMGSVTGGGIQVGLSGTGASGGDVIVETGSLHLQGPLTASGNVDISSGAQLQLTGGSLTSVAIDVNGTLTLVTTAADVPAVITAAGGVGVFGGLLESLSLGGTSTNTIVGPVANEGTITVAHDLRVINASHIFDTRIGTLEIAATQALEIANGAVLIASSTGHGIGTGRLDLQGSVTLTLEDDVTSSPTGFQLGLGSGNVTIDAATAVTFTNTTTLGLADTTFSGNVELANQGTLLVAAGRTAVLDGGLLQTGTIDLIGGTASAPTLTVNDPFTNAGQIFLRTSASDQAARLNVTGGQLVNAGTITSTTQGGTASSTLNADLLNQNLLDVQHGLILAGTQTGGNVGTITIAAGKTLQVNGNFANNAGGVIQGNGTVDVAGFALTNSGVLRPGTSPGTLNITGDLTLTPNSQVDIELGGTAPGQFDAITVSGAATLDGTLNLALVNGYSGIGGDSFQILATGSVSGTFAAVNPPDLGFVPAYAATGVTLTLDSIVNRWIGASGDWTVASNWSRGSVPTAAEDVIIDVTGDQIITVLAGNTVFANDLLLRDELLITQSTLTLGGILTVDPTGILTLSAGIIAGAGGVANAGLVRTGSLSLASIANIISNTGTLLARSDSDVTRRIEIGTGFTNNGVIQVDGAGVNGEFYVFSGTLTNQGTILSTGTSASSNRVGANVLNQGLISVNEDLVFEHGGKTYTQDVGARLQMAPGETLTWNGGALDLQQPLVIGAGQSVVLNFAAVNGASAIANSGTLSLQQVSGSALLNNQGGTVESSGITALGSIVQQTGLLRIRGDDALGGGQLVVASGFTNSGTLELQTSANGSGALLALSGGTQTLTNAGLVRASSLGAASNNSVQTAVFDTSAGALEIGAGVTLSALGGTVRLGTGTDLGAGSGTFDMANNATLELMSDFTYLDSGGRLALSGSSLITAAAPTLLTNLSTLTLSNEVVSANVTLVNLGTLTLDGVASAGALDNRAGATVEVTRASSLAGIVQQAGILRIRGDDSLGAGTLSVASGFANSDQIELVSSGTGQIGGLLLSSGLLTNLGTLRSTGAGAAINSVFGSLDNQGTIEATQSLAVINPGLFDTGAGTLQISAGETLTVANGTTRIGAGTQFGAAANTGTLDLTGNAELQLASDVTINGVGAQLMPSGLINITAGAPTALTNAGTLTLSNEVIGANVTLVNLDTLTLDGVAGAGALDNRAGATVEVTRASSLGGIVQQAGMLRIRGDDTLGAGILAVSSGFTNASEMQLQSSATGESAALQVSSGTLTNVGTLRSAGAGAISNTVFGSIDNQGTIEVQRPLTVTNPGLFDTSAGTLQINAGETLTVLNGTTRIGAGTQFGAAANTGTLDLAGNANLQLASDVTINGVGAQLAFSGLVDVTAVAPAALTNAGTLTLNNEVLDANVALVNLGTLNLAGAGGNGVLDNRATGTIDVTQTNIFGTLDQAGILRIRGDETLGLGQLSITGSATNTGTIELEGSATGQIAVLAVSGSLVNNGTLRSLSANSNANVFSGTLDNRSLVEVLQPLDVVTLQPIPNSGVIRIANGATLSFHSGYTNSGTIEGDGTIALPGFALTNAGTLSPGASPGLLTIDGDLVLGATSVLEFEIAGVSPTEFDRIDVMGAATLDGSVNLTLPGAYTPTPGDAFTILTADSISGTFAQVTGFSNTPIYGTKDVTIELASLSVFNSWLGGTGSWFDAARWSLGTVPGSGHDVLISADASNVTIPAGSNLSVNSVLLTQLLLMDTSSLEVATLFTIGPGGTLQLSSSSIVGAVDNQGTIAVLPASASSITRILSNTGQILVQSNATTPGGLTVGEGFVNDGTIRLSAAGANAGFDLSSGKLVNRGTIVSEGTSVGANRLSGSIENRGVLQVDEDLRVDNIGTVFTQAAGADVNIASGQTVFFNGGELELQGDLSIDAGAGVRLSAVTVSGTAALANAGELRLDSANVVNVALDNQGTLMVPPGANVINGLLTHNGTVRIAAGTASDAALTVTSGLVNDGTIELVAGDGAFRAMLTVIGGGLLNNGTIDSQTAGGAAAALLDAEITNAGTIQLTNGLDIANGGKTFDTRGGRLGLGTQTLTVGQGTVRMGTATDFGVSTGTLAITGAATLNLAGDLLVPASGWTLDLAGAVQITASAPALLINQGTLALADDVLDAPVTLVNEGALTYQDTSGSGALDNRAAGVIDVHGRSAAGSLAQAGTLRIHGAASGEGELLVSGAATNTGTIVLEADGAAGVLNAAGGISNNTGGVMQSTALSAGSPANRVAGDVISNGQLDASHALTLINGLTIPSTAAGVVITGAGDLSVDGAFTVGATGFPVTFAGAGTLSTRGASTVNGAQLLLDGRAWSNLGALDLNGRLTLGNGALLDNQPGATITLSGTNATPLAAGTGAASVVNSGTFTKTSAALQSISTGFDNAGTVNVGAGVLTLSATGAHSGTFGVNAAAELAFSAGTHVLDGADFGGPGAVRVNGATLDIVSDAVIANPVTLQSGSIAGAGGLTLDGPFTWSGGVLTGNGTLLSHGNVIVNNAAALLDGRSWTNGGALTLNGRLNLDNAATLLNAPGATLAIAAANADATPLLWDGTGGRPQLTNAGDFNKSSAAAQSLGNIAFTNSGALRVAAGTLAIAGFSGSNTGVIDIAGGSVLSTGDQPLINAAGGTIDVRGTLDLGAAAMTNAGTMNVGPGSVTASGVSNSGTLNLRFATLAMPVSNQGTIVVGPGSDSRIGGALTQTGTISLQADTAGGGTLHVADGFVNAGVIEMLAGGGNVALLYVDAGALTNAAGGTIRSLGSAGTYNYVQAAGGIVNLGLFDVAHDLFIDNPALVFDTANGVVQVASGATMTINGGGAGTAIIGGSSLGAGGGVFDVLSSRIELASDVTLDGTGTRLGTSGSTAITASAPVALTNRQTLDLQSDPVAASVTLVNEGDLTLSATPIGSASSGRLENRGTLRVTASSTVFDFAQPSGSTLVDAGKTLTVLGTFDWDGGTISEGVLASTLILRGTGTRVLSSGTLTGTNIQLASGTLEVRNGARLHSAGSTSVASAASLLLAGGEVSAGGSFTNSGVLTLDAGTITLPVLNNTGTLNFNGATLGSGTQLGNAGTVNVRSGSLVLSAGDGGVGGGSYALEPGASMQFNGGSYAIGSITGGSAQIAAGSVAVSSYSVPGTTQISGGALNIGSSGNLALLDLSGGSLGGAGSVQVGTLNLSGSGALLGTGDLSAVSFNQSGGTLAGNFNNLMLAHQGDFTVGPWSARNSLNLQAQGGTLQVTGVSLDAPSIAIAGSNVALDSASVGNSSTASLAVTTGGTLTLTGASAPAKLYSSGTMQVQAGSITLNAGAFGASIDPTDLMISTPGSIALNGGSGTNASAVIAGDSITLNAASLSLAGGTGSGAYAGVQGLGGSVTVHLDGQLVLSPGSGAGAFAGISAAGPLTVTASSCNGCPILSSDPFTSPTSSAGLYGNPVTLTLIDAGVKVDPAILVAVDVAQSGGDEELEEEDDEEKDAEQGGGGGQNQEEDDGKALPACPV